MTEPVLREDEIQGPIVHLYDGIEEADNSLPQWWLWSFYLAIFFGVGYWTYYQTFSVGQLPLAAYTDAKLEALNAGGEVTEPDLLEMRKDPLMVAAGAKLFSHYCGGCHAAGEGKTGPNLTDEYWLHGGAPMDIYTTISGGRPNGMASWARLGKGRVKQLAIYVMSMQNTNKPGKSPQGTLWRPATPAAATPSEVPAPKDPTEVKE